MRSEYAVVTRMLFLRVQCGHGCAKRLGVSPYDSKVRLFEHRMRASCMCDWFSMPSMSTSVAPCAFNARIAASTSGKMKSAFHKSVLAIIQQTPSGLVPIRSIRPFCAVRQPVHGQSNACIAAREQKGRTGGCVDVLTTSRQVHPFHC